jgi:hypothetical protein
MVADPLPSLSPVPPISSLSEQEDPYVRGRRAPADDLVGFNEVWTQYPNHRGKADAEKTWRALQPEPTLRQQMLEAIVWQRRLPEWREGVRFIPRLSTWLRGRRWQDEPSAGADLDFRSPAHAPTVWDRIFERIEVRLNRHTLNTWFKPLVFVEARENAIILEAPNHLFVEWLDKHYRTLFNEVLQEIGLGALVIELRVRDEAKRA